MPKQEITLVLDVPTPLTAEQQRLIGRDASQKILETYGTRAYYGSYTLVDGIRFNEYSWESERRVGPGEDRDWCVTEDELSDWDEDEDEW